MVYALLNKTGLLPQKENIVFGISGGRTGSTRELSHEESLALITYLKEQDTETEDPRVTKMRNKIYYYAHEMKWQQPHSRDKFLVADYKRIDDWCLQFSYLKKKLNQYTYAELPKLLSQFEMVYKSFLNII